MHEHTGQQARRLERQYNGSGTLTRSPHVAPRRHGLRRLAGAAVRPRFSAFNHFPDKSDNHAGRIAAISGAPAVVNKVNTVRRHVLHLSTAQDSEDPSIKMSHGLALLLSKLTA